MMFNRLSVIIMVFVFMTHFVSAQNAGDYRSRATGDWNQSSTWERFDGVVWVSNPMPFPPTFADGLITITSGHTVTMIGDDIIDEVLVNGTLTIGNGTNATNVLINTTAANVLVVNGRLNMRQASGFAGSVGATANGVKFNAGSTYDHQYTTTAGTIPLATWALTSTCLISSYTSNSAAPGNLNQNFGNFTFSTTNTQTANVSFGGNLQNVLGNLTLNPFTGRILTLGPTGATPFTLSVGGNLDVQRGTIFLANAASTITNVITITGSYIQTAAATVNTQTGTGGFCTVSIYGGFSRTGGNLIDAAGKTEFIFAGTNPQIASISGGNTLRINFTVASGSTLDLGTSALNSNNSGVFTLNSGGTLRLGSLSSSGALTASITGTFSKVYQPGSTIIFNGSGLQYLSGNYPNTDDITTVVSNGVGVVLTVTPYVLNGDLVLTSGYFDVSDTDITFAGDLTCNSNFIQVNSVTSLNVGNTGSSNLFGPLRVGGGSLGNFSLTTLREVELGSNLGIANNLDLSDGNLILGSHNLSIEGSTSIASGTITSTSASSITISGSGFIFPIPLLGSALGTLTVNHIDNTFADASISGDIQITNLNLELGTLTTSGNVQMASGGTITRSNGVLLNSIEAVTSYNVEYIGGAEYSGLELPSDESYLQDLTINSDASIFRLDTLLAYIPTVNGIMTITNDELRGSNKKLRVRGNVVMNDAILDSTSFIVDGISTFSGSTTPQFDTLEVTSAGALTVDASIPQLNIFHNFIMNGMLNIGTAVVEFNGTATQTINRTTDATPIGLYQVVIDKPGGDVDLMGPVSISNSLQLNTVTTINAGSELLTLLSSDAFTARVNALPAGASINGSVIAQRSFPNGSGTREYRYVASPVVNSTVADWKSEIPITGTFSDPSTGTGINSTTPSLFYYDETIGGLLNDRYVNYPSTGFASAAPIENGRGYALFVRSNSTITMDSRGTLAQHQQVVNVTAQSPAGVDDGWNLVGNPFAAPIDWSSVTTSVGVDDAIYTRDNTNLSGAGPGFVSYVGGVGVPASYDGIIESGQGFWVHATANGTITFNESNKVTSSAQYYRTSDEEKDLVRVFLTGPTSYDELVVRFKSGTSANFDGAYDAIKLMDTGFNISSLSDDNRKLVINSIPDIGKQEEVVVPLLIENINQGTYHFSINAEELKQKDVFLWDKLTDTIVNLEEGLDLSIGTGVLQSIDSRFYLVFRESLVTGLPYEVSNNVRLYPNPTQGNAYLVVNNFTAPTLTVSIINMSGTKVGSMEVANTSANEGQIIELQMQSFQAGIYLIRVNDQNQVVQKRLVKY